MNLNYSTPNPLSRFFAWLMAAVLLFAAAGFIANQASIFDMPALSGNLHQPAAQNISASQPVPQVVPVPAPPQNQPVQSPRMSATPFPAARTAPVAQPVATPPASR